MSAGLAQESQRWDGGQIQSILAWPTRRRDNGACCCFFFFGFTHCFVSIPVVETGSFPAGTSNLFYTLGKTNQHCPIIRERPVTKERRKRVCIHMIF
jgi:hypothetical protein